jgi:hypothetical protein
LAKFKQLDVGNKHAPTPVGSSANAEGADGTEVLPPLPVTASGEKQKPPQRQN